MLLCLRFVQGSILKVLLHIKLFVQKMYTLLVPLVKKFLLIKRSVRQRENTALCIVFSAAIYVKTRVSVFRKVKPLNFLMMLLQ